MNKLSIGRRHQGFSLIEVMIVVAIVGILSAIAYPSYSRYVVSSKRTDAQRALVEYAQSMERYFTANGRYSTAAGGTTCGGTAPSAVSLYAITCATATDTTFTITATPTTGTVQASDGNLTLTNTGAKTGTWKF